MTWAKIATHNMLLCASQIDAVAVQNVVNKIQLIWITWKIITHFIVLVHFSLVCSDVENLFGVFRIMDSGRLTYLDNVFGTTPTGLAVFTRVHCVLRGRKKELNEPAKMEETFSPFGFVLVRQRLIGRMVFIFISCFLNCLLFLRCAVSQICGPCL